MRVAFLSDVHANLPALWGALEDARRRGARTVVAAGDLVVGGPHPVEVLRLLRERKVASARGNMDRRVVELLARPGKLARKAEGGKWAAAAWTALQLGGTERDHLAALPHELRLTFGGAAVLITHGSPAGDEDYVFPSLTPAALAAKLGAERPAVLVCGHSHVPFARKMAGCWVVNCGSVGKPVDGDPRGSYALADFPGRGVVRARIVRFAYPVEEPAADLKRRRAPGFTARELRDGVKD